MNVQYVFDNMIKFGHYSEGPGGFVLMCHALRYAYNDGTITKSEYDLAISEIRGYLRGFGSLAGLLDTKKQPWTFADRLAIYKDWANKPNF